MIPHSKLWDCYIACKVQPKIGDFQLLGDSIFVRLANNVLNQPSKYVDGTSSLGYCVSGQRIKQLTRKVKNCEYTLHRKVAILIGTNDILNGSDLQTMVRHYRNLLRLLQLRSVNEFILVTLPPIPKLCLMQVHWELVRGFNHFVRALEDELANVIVVDILPIFVKQESPFIAAPWSSYNRGVPHTPLKRKASDDFQEITETPTKKISLDLLEEDDAKLSPFCRYLNRINRIEDEATIISDDDESEYHGRIRPRIEYPFWNRLKETIFVADDEVLDDQITSSPLGSPAPASPKSPLQGLTPTDRKITKLVSNFIYLDYYEIMYPLSKRMDMLHPNKMGLNLIKNLLDVACGSNTED